MTVQDPDDETDDPRQLAALIKGEPIDEIDSIDPDTDDPRQLGKLIYAARGTGRSRRR